MKTESYFRAFVSTKRRHRRKTHSDRIRRNLRTKTRIEVRERDRYCCVRCKSPNDLTIHHILSIHQLKSEDSKIINNINNLVVLCNECHVKIHRKKNCKTQFFLDYIRHINKKNRKAGKNIENTLC